MIFWHLGMTVLVARYVFRDPKMDLRWLMVGSLLPDVIDKPIGAVLLHETFGTHRLFAHALIFPVALLVIAMLGTRRGSGLCRGALALVIGCFLHIVLDGVWTSPEAFLWPFLGVQFPRVAGSDLGTLLADMVRSPLVWAGEIAGIGYLVYLWRKWLAAPGALPQWVRDGRVGMG